MKLFALSRALVLAALVHAGVADAMPPLPGTVCHTGDSATLQVQLPPQLQRGVPARVRVIATNNGSTTWVGEEQQTFPYRLGSWSRQQDVLDGSGPPNNQTIWRNWACNGQPSDDPLNLRAFISDPQRPGCSGRTVPPSGLYEFSFDIVTPPGFTGNSVQFGAAMVYDAQQTCQGWFGDVQSVAIPVVNATPTCNTTDVGIVENQWRLQVYNNETLSGNPVEVRYFAPNASGGFDFTDWNSGASACAPLEHFSTRLARKVFLTAGTYDFEVFSDDGYRLFINDLGQPFQQSWIAPQRNTFQFSGTTASSAVNTFVVEHFQATGAAGLRLNWQLRGAPSIPAPQNLTGRYLGAGNVELHWDSVSVATGYKLRRSSNANGPFTIDVGTTSGVNSTSFTEPNVTEGDWYYVVSALNGSNEGPQSTPAFVRVSNSGPGPICPTPSIDAPSDRWMLEMFNGTDLPSVPDSSNAVERKTDAVGDNGFNFQWTNSPPSTCINSSNYLVRMERFATFPGTGTYQFDFVADDGMRVWVDGQNVIDEWRNQVLSGSRQATIIGGSQRVRVEYFQGTGSAQAVLSWHRVDNPGPTPPPTPFDLRATVVDNTVQLNWGIDNPSGMSLFYRIKRHEDTACCFDENIRDTSDTTSYVDRNVQAGKTYYYVVSAVSSVGQESPNSNFVPAIIRAVPQASFNIELRGPDGSLVTPGTTLGLNTDGWPGPNPLEVRMLLSCPANHVNACIGPVDVTINSTDGKLRINGAASDARCLPAQNPGASFSSMRFICPSAQGVIGVPAGGTVALSLGIVVQPSQATDLNVSASWAEQTGQGFLRATSGVRVSAAAIHPLIVVPGILGTMPPSYDRGEFDPQLGVYTPLMDQLKAIGYEEGATVFRFPYDWRNSNRVTARFLRDRIRQVLATRNVNYLANDGKVDLLVHSMGGIITRTLVEDEGVEQGAILRYNPQTEGIRKVVFTASPHQGFPEDYLTREGNNWHSFLEDIPALDAGMNVLLWPAFIKKHWVAAHPNQSPPAQCADDPLSGTQCLYDYYFMSHDFPGGIDSVEEMLPVPNTDNYFGPYLCDVYSPTGSPPCIGRYPYGPAGATRPNSPLLPTLNLPTKLELLTSRIPAENLYVIYGTDPSQQFPGAPPQRDHDTTVVFDVKAPPPPVVPALPGWANGQPEASYTTPAGDDLVPEYSSNLKLLIGSIPDQNVAGFRMVNGQPRYGLSGPQFRHKQIMWSRELQSEYVPKWLAGLGRIPFDQTYVQPSIVGALNLGTGWLLSGECPVNLLFTDPQGRRLGYDPASGTTYREIPDTIYAAANSENQFMYFGNLPPGTYKLNVNAFADGFFRLSLNQLTFPTTPRRWLEEGNVRTGEAREYQIVIGPTPPNSNQPPVADAGPDQTVPAAGPTCTADVQLDGSRSSDPDGEALTYDWTGPFGYITGVRPLVTLNVGVHDITLLVQDGQQKGRKAHTHVTVTTEAPTVKSIVAKPSVLEPLDGKMHTVQVAVDVSAACSTASCKIVDVDSDEGTSKDWKVTGPLSVKLLAARSPDGDGRRYKLTIECTALGAPPVRKQVTVKVPPPGRMKGEGKLRTDDRNYQYKFDVSESRAGQDAGSVSVDIKHDDGDNDADDHKPGDKFRATRIDSVRFSNDDDIESGSGLKVDTVKVSGAGTWNGKVGYTFEMKATDAGEPGARRDKFKITIRDAQGKSVAHVDEKIDSGNNQSQKAPK